MSDKKTVKALDDEFRSAKWKVRGAYTALATAEMDLRVSMVANDHDAGARAMKRIEEARERAGFALIDFKRAFEAKLAAQRAYHEERLRKVGA